MFRLSTVGPFYNVGLFPEKSLRYKKVRYKKFPLLRYVKKKNGLSEKLFFKNQD